MLKVTLFIIPLILAILFSIICELISKPFLNSAYKFLPYLIYAVMGILFSALLYFIILKLNLARPYLGGIKEMIYGLGIGLVTSIFCGVLFSIYYKTGTQFNNFFEDIHLKMLANLAPAFLEEVGFRAGFVQGIGLLYGKLLACLGGSVPFGMAHLAGRLFGHPIGLMHVLGTTSAGLLLTLIYLKFGLFAAVACHWIWNSLCPSWVKALSLPPKGGVQSFEGSWTTITILLLMSLFLIVIRNGQWVSLNFMSSD